MLKPGAIVTEDEIISFVREHLAHYKAPKSVEFRDEIPKGGTGKILKRELREPYWESLDKKIN
jgi:long-chain acyl-CoA synthetase